MGSAVGCDSRHVGERILNHAGGTFAGVAGVYIRFEYGDEMCGSARLCWPSKLPKRLKHVDYLYFTASVYYNLRTLARPFVMLYQDHRGRAKGSDHAIKAELWFAV